MNVADVSTRVALVTGASRGIGAAIAYRLSQVGFHVVINYRKSTQAAEIVLQKILENGGAASIEQADVADIRSAREMAARIQERQGRLDVLVNNAGRSEDGFLLMMPSDKWWSLFNENVAAVVNCTRVLLPLLLAVRGRPTAIVNIASISGLRGIEGQTAYSSSKAAVIGFTRALSRELATKNVAVNCVAPGPIDTEMYKQVSDEKKSRRLEAMPLGRIGSPEEIAEVVVLLVEGKARFIQGQVIVADGGITA